MTKHHAREASKQRKAPGWLLRKEKRALFSSELIELFRWFPRCSELLHDTLLLYLRTGTRGNEICSMEGREFSEEIASSRA